VKAPLAGPAHVVRNLSRYIHRTAISNSRITDWRFAGIRGGTARPPAGCLQLRDSDREGAAVPVAAPSTALRGLVKSRVRLVAVSRSR
jgi:hypothetical protein